MIKELTTSIAHVAETAQPSVVTIGRNGRGTGFVVAQDRVVTSAHNLRDRTVEVTFADGRTEQGSVHGVDIDRDLVVIDVPTDELGSLEFETENAPAVGAAVVALSRGGHRARATLGFVSSVDQAFSGPRGRAVQGGIEHTAPLARGSSGGPVLDLEGAVVGVNTHRIGDGFYLARAADPALRDRITDLVAGRSPQPRVLGVALAPSEIAAGLRSAVGLEERAGLLVRGVEADSAAGRAGVLVGDLLIALDGTPLDTIDALATALTAVDGDTASLDIVRGAEEQTLSVVFDT